ncbi:hypothetical protein SDC9_104040 [bioreactor metagenome]|uniref:Uncharacterized protein n=1 Tax=bioreactor metagenome TaxID=1076179 RepID=A0A645AWR5_9ZZZZ
MENKLESDQTIETVGVVKGEKNKAAQKKIHFDCCDNLACARCHL